MLKDCEDCGQKISARAYTCPHCGRKLHMTAGEMSKVIGAASSVAFLFAILWVVHRALISPIGHPLPLWPW